MIRIIVQIVSNLVTELYGSKMKRVLIGYRGKKIALPYPFCSIEKKDFFSGHIRNVLRPNFFLSKARFFVFVCLFFFAFL